MQNNQLSAQSGGSGNKLFSGGGSGQRGQRKEQTVNPGRQHEEARTNDDTQRRGGELIGKTDDIHLLANQPTNLPTGQPVDQPGCEPVGQYTANNPIHFPDHHSKVNI